MAKIKPLAYRMRPTHIDEVIGQKHLLGKNKSLYQMVQNGRISSIILYGPPGTGKTTIASAIAGSSGLPFQKLNAVAASKKDLIKLAEESEKSDESILVYIDEIHRFTRTQVEYLLPLLESGDVILIGSTTESVYHKLPSAILSRCTLYELKPLEVEEIKLGLRRALEDRENGLGEYNVSIEDKVLIHLAETTGGDMRSALNALETVIVTNVNKESSEVFTINNEMVEEVTNKKNLGYNGEDSKYDLLSSFQKSIRGSDVDAALYYLGMLITSGDLENICRRLSIIAFEDISLADPSTWSAVMAATDCAEKVGFPEAKIPLANAVALLCLSPKSNTAYEALDNALSDIQNGAVHPIPKHLRDAHYKGAAERGNGIEYLYPHSYPNGWVNQQYLPDKLVGRQYYYPKEVGVEKKLGMTYQKLNEMKNQK